MKYSLLSLFLSIWVVWVPASAEDWIVSGKTYRNVVVGQIEADCIHITFDGGVGSVNLADLPPDRQKQFGYDPEKAAHAAERKAYEQRIAALESHVAELQIALTKAQQQGTIFRTITSNDTG